MINLDVISFFALVLILSSILLSRLWNSSFRNLDIPPMSVGTGINVTAAWFFFSTAFLVFLESVCNLLSPGIWKNELLFSGLKQETMPVGHSPLMEILFRWFYFPKRVLSEVVFDSSAIMIGLAVLGLVLIFVEISGYMIAGRKWRFRWGLTFPAAFILLYIVSYSSIGFVRQLGWLIFSAQ